MRCPVCDKRFSAHSCVTDLPRLPEPGDVSVCIKCGALLTFDSHLQLAVAEASQLEELDFESLRAVAILQKAIREGIPPSH